MLGEDKKVNEKRNLMFYKLLGQNYEVLVNAILRGKDIYYEIPKEYQLNTKKPFILDWLLDYGKPNEIAKVRGMGNVKLLCIYNALLSWIDTYPDEENKWLYWQDWEDYFSNNPKALKRPKKPTKKKEIKEKPIEVVVPEMNFFTKKGNFLVTNGIGDVFISISGKQIKDGKAHKLVFHFRNSCFLKFECDYLIFARYENRIYFKKSTINEGFKITNKTKARAIISPTIEKEDIPTFQLFCSKELELKYDELYKMYYVEVKEE